MVEMQISVPRVKANHRTQRRFHSAMTERTAKTTWKDGKATTALFVPSGRDWPDLSKDRAPITSAWSSDGAKPSTVHGPAAGHNAKSAAVRMAAKSTASM